MIELADELLKYWIELCNEEFLQNPTDGLILLYKSMVGVFDRKKFKGVDNK